MVTKRHIYGKIMDSIFFMKSVVSFILVGNRGTKGFMCSSTKEEIASVGQSLPHNNRATSYIVFMNFREEIEICRFGI